MVDLIRLCLFVTNYLFQVSLRLRSKFYFAARQLRWQIRPTANAWLDYYR